MKIAERFAGVEGSDIRAVVDRCKELEESGAQITHFEIGRPNFDTPAVIKEAAKAALDAGKVHYGPNAGTAELRAAIADYLNRRYGQAWKPGQVMVTNGAIEAIFVSLMTVVNPGDEVLIPEPCWPYFIPMVRIMGGVPKLVPAEFDGAYRPDIAALEKAVTQRTKAILVNSPNNPTGAMFAPEALREIARLAEAHDLLVLADEVYERIQLGERGAASIVSEPGMFARTAMIGAFSKSYSMTGWRIGYVALPEPLCKPALLTHTYVNTSINTFVQDGAVAALRHAEADVERMVASYRERHEECHRRLNAMPGVTCHRSTGSFFLFPRFADYPDDRELALRLLEEAHVATVPGSSFGPSGGGHLRISLTCDWESMVAGLDRMESWLVRNRAAPRSASRQTDKMHS